MSEMKARRVDVVIVGGGPVGLSLALALARFGRGLKIALVDRRPLSVAPDNRASAISAGVRRVFEALGVWDAMADSAEPVRQMQITDSGSDDIARPLFLSFAGDVAPGEPFAHMVPNQAMVGALLAALGEDVEIVAPAEIASLDGTGGQAQLRMRDGAELMAPLVVAADGAQSGLRDMAGIGLFRHDYRQSGLVTTIVHELAHEGIAYEHFRPAGPFASLPLPGNRSSLVWTERAEDAGAQLQRSEAELAGIIEAVMGSSLGTVELLEPVRSFPLRLQLAHSFVGQRLALVGDAAHVIHPVAGQGLNLGLKDVAALAEVIIEAARLGMDHGAEDVLARYQRWRRLDTATMAMVTDGMNRLFSNDLSPLRSLRDLGLALVDRSGPIKDAMIRSAAGLTPRGPKLLAGQAL